MFTAGGRSSGGGGGGGGGRRQEHAPAPPPEQQRGHRGGSGGGGSRGGSAADTSRGGSTGGGSRGGSIDSSRGGSIGYGGSIGGGGLDGSASNSRSGRTAVQAKPSTAQPVTRPTPMARQATGAALVPAAVAVAPPMPANNAAEKGPPPSYFAPPASGSALAGAPPSTEGAQVLANEPEVYLHTDTYPFTSEQFDREKERLLGQDRTAAIGDKVPQMDLFSHKQLNLTSSKGRTLEELDLECARKHLEAIKDSATTHKDLYGFTLMEGEDPVQELDLAGLENAPGLFDEVTQQCRLVFTNKGRLVFTQTNHSAEVGLTKLPFLAYLLTCCHDRWSHRKYTSYYAAIKASEVLQVFVQQTLSTNYQTSSCTWHDVYDLICCPMGGTMYSEKDMNGATQTLGDHDPGDCMSKWDKTRYMRHALVIRYVDCASNAVVQTTAMARPATPASELYEMARLIDASITMTMADWLKHKALPTPLVARPFHNEPPAPPLFRRTSYKFLLFVLLIVALSFLSLNVTAAIFMIAAVLVALAGSYSKMKMPRNAAAGAMGLMSKTLIGTQGGGLLVYAISFAVVVSAESSKDDETGY